MSSNRPNRPFSLLSAAAADAAAVAANIDLEDDSSSSDSNASIERALPADRPDQDELRAFAQLVHICYNLANTVTHRRPFLRGVTFLNEDNRIFVNNVEYNVHEFYVTDGFAHIRRVPNDILGGVAQWTRLPEPVTQIRVLSEIDEDAAIECNGLDIVDQLQGAFNTIETGEGLVNTITKRVSANVVPVFGAPTAIIEVGESEGIVQTTSGSIQTAQGQRHGYMNRIDRLASSIETHEQSIRLMPWQDEQRSVVAPITVTFPGVGADQSAGHIPRLHMINGSVAVVSGAQAALGDNNVLFPNGSRVGDINYLSCARMLIRGTVQLMQVADTEVRIRSGEAHEAVTRTGNIDLISCAAAYSRFGDITLQRLEGRAQTTTGRLIVGNYDYRARVHL